MGDIDANENGSQLVRMDVDQVSTLANTLARSYEGLTVESCIGEVRRGKGWVAEETGREATFRACLGPVAGASRLVDGLPRVVLAVRN